MLEPDFEFLRSDDFGDQDSWSGLATSFPIAMALNRSLSDGRAAANAKLVSESSDQTLRIDTSSKGASPFAIGFIQQLGKAIPREGPSPLYLTLTLLPVRVAVQNNLNVLGVRLGQYQAGSAESPFMTYYAEVGSPILSLAARAPDLMPTALQTKVPHRPYVDIIPCRKVRDKILEMLAGGNLDQAELCIDIEMGVNVWGRTPWDRRSWEWSSGFVGKWSMLFEEDETLDSTRFWRAQRGETGGEVSDESQSMSGSGRVELDE